MQLATQQQANELQQQINQMRAVLADYLERLACKRDERFAAVKAYAELTGAREVGDDS